MKLVGNTLPEVLDNLTLLRRVSPYRFGGRLFVAMIGEQAHGERTRRDLVVRASKAGLQSLEIAEVGGQAEAGHGERVADYMDKKYPNLF